MSVQKLILLLLFVTNSGCWWIQDASERGECDRALDVVCSCTSVDCDADPPHPTVDLLRRCDGDEIFRSRDFHLSLCIQDASQYCAILDSLASSDTMLCDIECTQASACDLEDACHEFQFEECDAP